MKDDNELLRVGPAICATPLGKSVFLDARDEKIRHNGNIISCAVLIATGINPEGKRTVLGVSCQLSEAEIHWREFLQSLQERGLHGVEENQFSLLRRLSQCASHRGSRWFAQTCANSTATADP